MTKYGWLFVCYIVAAVLLCDVVQQWLDIERGWRSYLFSAIFGSTVAILARPFFRRLRSA